MRTCRPAHRPAHPSPGRTLVRLTALGALAGSLLCALLWLASAPPGAANPDLFSISKSANPGTIKAGQRLDYVIHVTNLTTFSLGIDIISDTLPSGATVVDAGGGTVDGGVISWINQFFSSSEARDYTFGVVITQVGSGIVSNNDYGARSGSETRMGAPVDVTITAADPAVNRLEATPNPATVGDNISLVSTVTDQYGNPNIGETVSYTFDQGSIDGQPAGSIVTGVTDSAGQVVKTLTGVTSVGTARITATVGSASPAVAVITFNPGPPASLTTEASPAAIVANGSDAATITATVRDAYNNPVASTPVSFSTDLGTLNPGGSASIVVNTTNGVAVATLRGTQVGQATVTVSVGSLDPAYAPITLTPGPPDHLVLYGTPGSIPVGGNTSDLTLLIYDAFNNRVNVPTVVTFTTSLGTLTGGGSSYVQIVSDGLAQAQLASSNQAGIATVSGAAAWLSPVMTQVAFVPGPAASIGLEVRPASIPADAESTATLTATVRDAYGNLVDPPVIVTFAAGDGTLLPDSSGLTANGVLVRTLRSSATVGHNIPITASADGVPTPATGSIDFTVGPPVTATVSVNPPSPIVAGSYATLAVTVVDKMNNRVPGIEVTMSSSLGGIFSPTAVLSATATTDSNGEFTRYLQSTQIGPVILGATAANGPLAVSGDGSATNPISVVSGPPAQATLTAAPSQIYAIGTTTAVVTATIQDDYGNPVAGYVPNFTTSLGYLSGDSATNGLGVVTRTLHSTTDLGTALIAVTGLTTVTPATVEMVAGPVAAASLSTDYPTPYVYNTGPTPDQATLVITMTDAVGHPVVRPVNVTSTFGSALTFVSGCSEPNSQGVLSACVVRSTRTGTPTFYVDGVTASGAGPEFRPGPAYNILVSPSGTPAAPVAINAGIPVTFTASAIDQYGNPVQVAYNWLVQGYGTNPGSGSCTVIPPSDQCVVVGTRVGLAEVSARYSFIVGSSYVTITPGSAVSASVTASPQVVNTDVYPPQSNLTFVVVDQYGNRVRSGVSLAVTSTTGIGTLAGSPTDDSGTARWTIESYRAGTAVLSVTNLITLTGQRVVTFTPGVPYHVTVSASPNVLAANGISSTVVYFTFFDAHDNPVGAGHTMNVISASLGTLTGNNLTTDANSIITRTLTAAHGISSTVNFSVRYNNNPLLLSGDQVRFEIGPLDHVTVAPSGLLTVRVGQPVVLTMTAMDRWDAPILDSSITYFWYDPLCGSEVCQQVSPNNARQTTFIGTRAYDGVQLHFRATQQVEPPLIRIGSTNLNVMAGPPAAAQIVANPSTTGVNGQPITFTLSNVLDAYGNTVEDGAVITVTVLSSPQARLATGILSGGQVTLGISSTTQAGTYQVIATGSVTNPLGGSPLTSSLTLSGDTWVTFTPEAPYTATLLSATPPELVADGVSTSQIRLQVKDSFGNPVTGGWYLTPTATAGTILTDTRVTDAQGVITATLQAGTEVTRAYIRLDGTLNGTITAAGWVPLVAGPPYTVTISVDNPTLSAGGASTSATFDVRDQWNHPVADGTWLNPSLDPALGNFGPAGSARQTVGGLITQTLQPGTVAGVADIKVDLSGVNLVGTTSITVQAGSAYYARLTAQPVTPTVGMTTSLVITITDRWRNVVVPTPITLTAPGDRLDGVDSSVVKTTLAGSGQLTASLFSTVAGTKTLTLVGPEQGLVLTNSDTIVFWPGDPSFVSLEASTGVDANGVTTATVAIPMVITASSRDVYSNIIDGWRTVTYLWPNTPPSDAGQSSYPFQPDRRVIQFLPFRPTGITRTNWFTVNATLGTWTDAKAGIRVNVVPGLPTTATVTAAPRVLPADNASTYVITLSGVVDLYNNQVSDGNQLSVSVQGRSFSGLIAGGRLTGVLTSTFVAGVHPVVVTRPDGYQLSVAGDRVVTYTAGAPAWVAIVASPSQLPADGVSRAAVTVTVRDQYYNLVGNGIPVTITTNLGTIVDESGTPSPTGLTQDGQLVRYLRSAVALGEATLTGQAAGLSDQTQVSFVPGNPATAWLQATPSQVVADGTSTARITVTIKDAHNFTVLGPGQVQLSVVRGTLAPAATFVMTGSQAQITGVFTSSGELGSAGLAVVYAGQSLPVSGTLELVAGPAHHAIVLANPPTLTVRAGSSCTGGGCSTLTINLWDAVNRPVRDGTVVTVTSSLGGILSNVSTSQNGMVTRTLYPGTVAGTATLTISVSPAGSSFPMVATTTVPIYPGYLDVIEVRPGPQVTTTAGVPISFSATGYDAFHNPAGTGQFSWAKVNPSSPGVLSSDGVFTGTTVGSVDIWAWQGFVSSPIINIRVVPAAPATATVIATPKVIPVGGIPYGGVSQLAITALDSFGNRVADGTSLDVRTSLGTLDGTGTTRGGVLTRSLVSGLSAGVAVLRVHNLVGGPQVAAGDQVVIVKGGPVTATVTAIPNIVLADNTSQASLVIDQLLDVTGEPVSDGVTVTVSSNLGTLSCDGATPPIVHGSIACLLKSADVGTAQIYVNSFPAAGDVVNFIPGPPARVTVSADSDYLVADGVSSTTLTITAQDAYSHTATSAGALTVTTSLGSISDLQPTLNGVTTRRLTAGSEVGTAIISVTEATHGALSGQGRIPIVGRVATISANPTWLKADGTSTTTLTIEIRDAYGRLVTHTGPLTVRTTLGHISGLQPTVNGRTTRILTADRQSGTALITVEGVAGEGRVPFVGWLTDGSFEQGFASWNVGGDYVSTYVFTSTYPPATVSRYPGYAGLPVYTTAAVTSDRVGEILVTPLNGAGTTMARLGATTPDNTHHKLSAAWLSQPIYVPPADNTRYELSFYYRLLSYDVYLGSSSYVGSCQPGNSPPPCEWDPFEVRFNGQRVFVDGQHWSTDWQAWRGAEDSPPSSPQDLYLGWKKVTLDLTPYMGQVVMLQFRVANQQKPMDNTWVYLDRVQMSAQAVHKTFMPFVVR